MKVDSRKEGQKKGAMIQYIIVKSAEFKLVTFYYGNFKHFE